MRPTEVTSSVSNDVRQALAESRDFLFLVHGSASESPLLLLDSESDIHATLASGIQAAVLSRQSGFGM